MTDAAEISQGFFGQIGEIALGDDGCFVAAQPAEYLGTALVIGASPGGAGQDWLDQPSVSYSRRRSSAQVRRFQNSGVP